MTKTKQPEYAMTNNNGKRKLMDISNIPEIKLPHGLTALGLLNYVEQEHKNGNLQQITIKECQDKIIMEHTKKQRKQNEPHASGPKIKTPMNQTQRFSHQ